LLLRLRSHNSASGRGFIAIGFLANELSGERVGFPDAIRPRVLHSWGRHSQIGEVRARDFGGGNPEPRTSMALEGVRRVRNT
jgi:hypothetical protein